MENEITATYDSDSKRYHRFMIDEGQEITGTIYIPKDKKVPDSVTISLKTRGDQKGVGRSNNGKRGAYFERSRD